jgi:hypothetical protein
MIIESWLNERATNETRGLIFSLYMTVTYVAIVSGQMSIALGMSNKPHSSSSPAFSTVWRCCPPPYRPRQARHRSRKSRLDLRLIYRNSPVSFVAMLMIGIANGAFGTLAPVFGASVGLATITIATMMSITIFSGALDADSRRPDVGQDGPPLCARRYRRNRQRIRIGNHVVKTRRLADLFGLIALYGAMSYTLYSIIVAHANDYAANDQFVTVSSGLLLLYGIGTIIGPLISGVTMAYSPYLLFAVTAAAHFAVAAYAIFRSFVRASVPDAEKETFASTPSARAATPNRSISIRAQPHPRNDHLAAKLSPGVEHDLSDVLAIFHALMSGRGLIQRINRIHHWQHFAFTEQRPDMVTQLIGDHRLESDVAGAQRRAGVGQPLHHQQ